MHNPVNTTIAFVLLVGIVGTSFVYAGLNAEPITVRREPWLGIEGVQVTQEIADAMDLPSATGLLVTNVVPGSPAEWAGIREGSTPFTIENREINIGGDVIIGADNFEILTVGDLRTFLGSRNVGDAVTFTVQRNNSEGAIVNDKIDVTLEEKP